MGDTASLVLTEERKKQTRKKRSGISRNFLVFSVNSGDTFLKLSPLSKAAGPLGNVCKTTLPPSCLGPPQPGRSLRQAASQSVSPAQN